MRNGFAHPDGPTRAQVDEWHAEYRTLECAMEEVADHWTGLLDREVNIEFAQRPKRHVTGYVSTEDDYDGPDDYRLQVRVDGSVVTVHSLIQAEDYLERVWG